MKKKIKREMLHFMAPWCQPCYASKPIVEKYLQKNPDIIHTEINIEDEEKMKEWEHLNISAIPSFVGLINDRVHRGHWGVPTFKDLDSIFQP